VIFGNRVLSVIITRERSGMEQNAVDVFIPKSVLEELTKKSYERISGVLVEAVQGREDLFGEGEASVVATFPSYSIVATSGGSFFRVKYDVNKDGGVTLKESEKVDIPIMTREAAGGFVRSEARKVLDEFFATGSTDKLRTRLREVSDAVFSGLTVTPEGVEEQIKIRLADDRVWKQNFRQNEDTFKKFVGSGLEKIESSIPKAKFAAILDNTIGEDRYAEYQDIAIGSLQELVKYVDAMVESAKKALDSSFTLKDEFQVEDADSAVSEFKAFLEDYADDVSGLHEELKDALAVASDSCLLCMVTVHDSVTAKMYEYKLASAFVDQYANRFVAK